MNELMIFDNEEFGQIRGIEIEGEPWFVAADVCRTLEIGNTSQALSRLDEDEKDVILNDTLGGVQKMSIVNEPGLYTLVLGSRKDEAKGFKRWITHEVIPSIRKTGKYEVQQTPKTYLEALKALVAAEEEKQILALENAEMKPKADYCEKILESTNTMLVTQIAQDYGMSAIAFNKILHEFGIQRKVNGQWILYEPYLSKKYTKSHTHSYERTDGSKGSRPNTEWTQEGRKFLYHFLKEHNILPLIEREG